MNAITLFAGAGGADLGMRRAGVHHLACVEGWATACETLKAAGFPAVNAWIGEGGALPAWQWQGGTVDLLWGSPPCQPYSAAGKRLGADDPRDGWPATLEAIRTVRPRWVIVENVGGAPVENWAADLGGSMFRAGLYAHVSTRTLDAADWGLPSHRVRQFLVAGPKPYRWPEPTHAGPDAPVGARVRLLPWVGMETCLIPGKPQEYLGRGRGGSEPWRLALPSAGLLTREVKGTRASAANGYTFTGGPDGAADSIFLALGRRRADAAECAALVGFPVGYPFAGNIGDRYRQIGNAVAPVMAEALARGILEAECA